LVRVGGRHLRWWLEDVKTLTPCRRVATALGSMTFGVLLAVLDGVRITQACQRIGRHAVWDLLWGALAMLATAVLLVRAGRTDVWVRTGFWARTFQWTVGVWCILLCVAFVATHPWGGSNGITSSLAVGIDVCAGGLLVAGLLAGGVSTLRPEARGMPAALNAGAAVPHVGLSHQHSVAHSQHHAEVWHVDVSREDPDYFIAHCDCDWVGAAHIATEPNAEASARHDANGHATTVAPVVVEI
jgi:hypothetical protein